MELARPDPPSPPRAGLLRWAILAAVILTLAFLPLRIDTPFGLSADAAALWRASGKKMPPAFAEECIRKKKAHEQDPKCQVAYWKHGATNFGE